MSLAAEAITIYPQISRLEQRGSASAPSSPTHGSSSSLSASSLASPPPNIAPSHVSISYSLSSTELTDCADRSAYSTTALPFIEEFGHLSSLTSLLAESESYTSLLYTYRSVSKAMPMVQQDATEAAKQQIHELTFAILRPEVLKVRQLMEYSSRAVKVVTAVLAYMQRIEAERRVPSDPLYLGVVQVLDLLLLLDALKDMKTCLINDFSRYKRAFTPIRAALSDSESLSEEIHQLQMFLSFPSSPHNLIYYRLREEVQRLPGYDVILCNLLSFSVEQLDRRRHIDSDEYHMYYRILSHLLYLIDQQPSAAAADDSAGKKAVSINVFRYAGRGRLELDRVKRYVRLMPIIPLYMDMHIDVQYVLKRCPHWEDDKMRGDWQLLSNDAAAAAAASSPSGTAASPPPAVRKDKTYQRYHLVYQRQRIRQEYTDYCVAFTQQTTALEHFTSNNAQVSSTLLHSFFYTLLTGLRLLSSWRAKIQEQCAWKYAFPCPLAAYTAQGGKGGEGREYEQAVRFNYTSEELYALVDVLGMLKGLAELLLAHQLLIEVVVRRTVHDDMQTFLQAEVGESARKAHKHKRGAVRDVMLQMRDIAGDWSSAQKKADWQTKQTDGAAAASSFSSLQDNLNFLQDNNTLVPNRDFPLRAVAASPMQIAFMRRIMHTVYSDKSAGMQGGLFSEKDLKKESTVIWNDYYDLSFFYPYLLSIASHVRRAQDLSFLWYREFYLELTKCIQFPISMSLPWILTEYLVSGSNSQCSKASIFYTMDLYNDAANASLLSLKQQYLFDEVQAELGVSFEQLVFHLSEAIYRFYLVLANERLLSRGYAKRWYEAGAGGDAERARLDKYAVKDNKYVVLMQQSSLTLLGRSVDLTAFITSRLNLKLREYVDTAIRKFEASELSEVVELRHLLDVAALMHAELQADGLPLDRWEEIMKEVNEDTTVGQFRNRILFHVLSELLSDLLPSCVYNSLTDRFVRAGKSFVPAPDRSRMPSNPASYFFSPRHSGLYSALFSSFRAYFGAEHFLALLSLLHSLNSFPLMLSELSKELHSLLFTELYPYSLALLTGLPLFKLPTIQYTILGVYGFLDVKLRTSLGVYAPLRGSVFHVLREIGNVLFFLRGLEEAERLWKTTGFMFSAHFQGIKCRGRAERGDGVRAAGGIGALMVKGNGNQHSYVSAVKESAAFFQQTATPQLFPALTSLAEQSSRMYAYSEKAELTSSTSQAMQQIIASLASIESAWVSPPPQPTGTPPDQNAKNDMVRLLSCLLFIFTQPPDYNAPPASSSSPAVDDDNNSYIGRDSALFGDGFLLAVSFLLHSLRLRQRFAVEDYSQYVVGLEALHPVDRDKFVLPKGGKPAKAQWTDAEKQERQLLDFIRNVKQNREKMSAMMGWLSKYASVSRKGAKAGSAALRAVPPREEGEIGQPVRLVAAAQQ